MRKRFNTRRSVSRRDFIQLGSLALGSLPLSTVLQTQALAASPSFLQDRAVVLLYLSGGASQIETFDPKMGAALGNRSITGEVPTKLPGISFGGTFSELSQRADQLAVVRSFGHSVGDHERAHVHVLSGGTDAEGRQKQGFSLGSFCTRLAGPNHPETGLPHYALLTEEEIDRQFRKELSRVRKGSWPGELGPQFAPVNHQVGWKTGAASGSQPGGNPPLANMELRIGAEQLDDRLALRRALDRLKAHTSVHMESLDKYSQQAVDLVLGGAARAFNLDQEDAKTLARYDTSQLLIGHNAMRPSTLGKQLLVARRLCEAGCRFVTVHSAGWDMHADGNNPGMEVGMKGLGKSLDVAVSAFLDDVRDRRLQEKILLVLVGDFGRTPKVNKRGGRDHWAKLSPLVFAGGGLQMGQVIGQSNRDASAPQSQPYTTSHLMSTVVHTLFDVGQLRLVSGLPRSLTDLIERGRPIEPLL